MLDLGASKYSSGASRTGESTVGLDWLRRVEKRENTVESTYIAYIAYLISRSMSDRSREAFAVYPPKLRRCHNYDPRKPILVVQISKLRVGLTLSAKPTRLKGNRPRCRPIRVPSPTLTSRSPIHQTTSHHLTISKYAADWETLR